MAILRTFAFLIFAVFGISGMGYHVYQVLIPYLRHISQRDLLATHMSILSGESGSFLYAKGDSDFEVITYPLKEGGLIKERKEVSSTGLGLLVKQRIRDVDVFLLDINRLVVNPKSPENPNLQALKRALQAQEGISHLFYKGHLEENEVGLWDTLDLEHYFIHLNDARLDYQPQSEQSNITIHCPKARVVQIGQLPVIHPRIFLAIPLGHKLSLVLYVHADTEVVLLWGVDWYRMVEVMVYARNGERKQPLLLDMGYLQQYAEVKTSGIPMQVKHLNPKDFDAPNWVIPVLDD